MLLDFSVGLLVLTLDLHQGPASVPDPEVDDPGFVLVHAHRPRYTALAQRIQIRGVRQLPRTGLFVPARLFGHDAVTGEVAFGIEVICSNGSGFTLPLFPCGAYCSAGPRFSLFGRVTSDAVSDFPTDTVRRFRSKTDFITVSH